MLWKVTKGLYFVLALFMTSWLGCCFIMLPSLLLAVILPHTYRSYVQFMMGTWLLFPPSAYELIFGTTIHVSGDKMKRNEKSMIISNHRTRLDWMFLWSVTGRARWSSLLKIILRGDLRHILGFGWAMQFGGFYFLSRKWVKDEEYLTRKIKIFNSMVDPFKLLIFPEGTDFDAKTKAKSDVFGEKEGRPYLTYLLHPRTTGFIHCVKELRKGDVPALYDVTIGYPKTLPDRGELDLLTGRFPEEIHVHVRRHEFANVPEKPEEVDQWLRELWYEKEKILAKFYQDGKFPDENAARPYFPASSADFRVPMFLIWNAGLVMITYLLFVSPTTRLCFLVSNIILIILSTLGLIEDIDAKFDPEIELS